MGPGIIIPVAVLAIAVPVVFAWARRLRDGAASSDGDPPMSGARLTSNALRQLPAPPWRIVYEIAADKLDGVEHVVVGPPGIFAVITTMDPMPVGSAAAHDPHDVARAAIARGGLDDALARCAMSSDALVTVHWGPPGDGPAALETVPGALSVDGRSLAAWACALDGSRLAPAQIDLAWQTVTTTIGRPDPLA